MLPKYLDMPKNGLGPISSQILSAKAKKRKKCNGGKLARSRGSMRTSGLSVPNLAELDCTRLDTGIVITTTCTYIGFIPARNEVRTELAMLARDDGQRKDPYWLQFLAGNKPACGVLRDLGPW